MIEDLFYGRAINRIRGYYVIVWGASLSPALAERRALRVRS